MLLMRLLFTDFNVTSGTSFHVTNLMLSLRYGKTSLTLERYVQFVSLQN